MRKIKTLKELKKAVEKMSNEKKILLIILMILFILGGTFKVIAPDSKINNIISETQEIVWKEIVVSEETEELSIQTKEAVNKNEELETKEVLKSSEKEEQKLEEENLEIDAQVEQENISYDGDISGKGLSLLGKCQGLTYYSQADSRWANTLYTSTNNKSQTIKSSGCGPTSAAMIVSSSKGAILPNTMAKLFVDNGYRTASSGTAWSAYSFVADYFDFKEYYTTSDFSLMTKYLKQTKSDGSNKYYVIASCGSGLFTSSGHYIVLVADKNGNITVYDPYVYAGKFTTASRKKANVKLNGNVATVTETNFKKYANYKNFWIYSNDKAVETKKKSTSYTRYVKVKTNLNVRKDKNTKSKKVGSLKNGTKVTVTKTSGKWSYITSPIKGWVKTEYLTKTKPTTVKNTVGKTKTLKKDCTLYSKSNLTGKKYNYKKNTTVKILKNISSSVDYVQVKSTGRKAYIKNSLYK